MTGLTALPGRTESLTTHLSTLPTTGLPRYHVIYYARIGRNIGGGRYVCRVEVREARFTTVIAVNAVQGTKRGFCNLMAEKPAELKDLE